MYRSSLAAATLPVITSVAEAFHARLGTDQIIVAGLNVPLVVHELLYTTPAPAFVGHDSVISIPVACCGPLFVSTIVYQMTSVVPTLLRFTVFVTPRSVCDTGSLTVELLG